MKAATANRAEFFRDLTSESQPRTGKDEILRSVDVASPTARNVNRTLSKGSVAEFIDLAGPAKADDFGTQPIESGWLSATLKEMSFTERRSARTSNSVTVLDAPYPFEDRRRAASKIPLLTDADFLDVHLAHRLATGGDLCNSSVAVTDKKN